MNVSDTPSDNPSDNPTEASSDVGSAEVKPVEVGPTEINEGDEGGEIVDGRYPDIEIYMQRVELSTLIEWLQSRLKVTNVQQKGKSTVLTLDEKTAKEPPMTCTIVPDAVKGHFTSVWITPNKTSWLTDQDFARDAFGHFQLETRCSTGSWDGNDEQGWLRLTQNGESIVNWLAD